MWKYECKRHLLYLLIAAIAGGVLFGLTIDDSFVKEMSNIYDWVPITIVMQVYELRWLVGALIGAAFVNAILLLRYLIIKFNISPFIILMLFFFVQLYQFLILAGLVLLLPSVLVCLYGMFTAHNAASKNFRTLPKGNGNEVERVYRLHHAFNEDVKELASKCRKESDRWSIIYVLGLLALACVALIIPNMMLMLLLLAAYSILFVYVFRLRAQSVMPINALLFDECDPIACASAILLFSKRGKRSNLKMHLLFAQCMLCLDDPQLAMDALVLMPRNRSNSSMELNYQTLLAEANYQLGDRAALERNLESVRSTRVNLGSAGNMLLQESIASIQNKLYLMDERFDQCEAYYRQALPQLKLRLQQVNARYYLGMIAFINKDLETAKDQFDYVVQYGNTTTYKNKAQKYLGMIERSMPKEETE